MEIVHGAVSADSHGNVAPDTWTSRMSEAKWGALIPHIVEMDDPKIVAMAHMEPPFEGPVDRWLIYGQLAEPRCVCNAPAVMSDPQRRYQYQRWSEVPLKVYDPIERLKALDEDGVDAEVLFPNSPVLTVTFFQGDPEFELDCVRAHNDHFAEWRRASDRYAPLAMVPYLSDIDVAVEEATRAQGLGHRGIIMVAEPSQVLKEFHHFNDPYWNPLWARCEELDIPVHWHAGAGLRLDMPIWKGYSRHLHQAIAVASGFSAQAQMIPNLLFSGVLDRYPHLKFVCAEAGLGWINYILEGCDHEWERRHLWTEGLPTPPSELFRRQVYVNFWYEDAGIEMRHNIGIDHIMWESDYPHSTSTYPDSKAFMDRTLKNVPDDEREMLLYRNAMKLYKL